MLKCKIDRKKGTVRVKAEGDLKTLTTETLALIKELRQGIEQKNPEAAKEFRNTIIGAMLDPKSPLWKED